MVDLASFPDELSADLLVSRLKEAGIPAACLGGHIKNTNLFFALCLNIKVVVRQGDLERAREVLAEQFPSQSPDEEGWEDEAEQAPAEDE